MPIDSDSEESRPEGAWREGVGQLAAVTDTLKSEFVGNDDLIELMVTCAVAREPLLIVGPPGTAKSLLVRRFAELCGVGAYFSYMLTRFTEPDEILGVLDRRSLAFIRGNHSTVQAAEIAFLDEVFRASSSILNALLTVMNEGHAPRIFTVGSAQEVPDDPSLKAFFDRFVLRFWLQNVSEHQLSDLLSTAWELERRYTRTQPEDSSKTALALTSPAMMRTLNQALTDVRLDGVLGAYREIIKRIRDHGIRMSDRRAIKLQKMVASSALRRGALGADVGDCGSASTCGTIPVRLPRWTPLLTGLYRLGVVTRLLNRGASNAWTWTSCR